MPLDPGRDFAIGDPFHFKRVKFAEIGDLIEGERCVFDQPHRGGLGHKRRIIHGFLLLGAGPSEIPPICSLSLFISCPTV